MPDEDQDRKTTTAPGAYSAGSDPAGSDPALIGVYDTQSPGTQPKIDRVSTFERSNDRPASRLSPAAILIALIIFALLAFLLLQWIF